MTTTDAGATWHRLDTDDGLYRTAHRPPVHLLAPAGISTRDVAALTETQWRDLVCMHEAGHFVIGQRLGLPAICAEVAISADEDRGQVRFGPWEDGTNWVDVAVMNAAGQQAAMMWLHQSGLYTPARGWVAEMAGMRDRTGTVAASALPLSVHTNDPTAWHDWRQLCATARRLLDECWPTVTAVAAALADRGHLTADDLHTIARHAPLGVWS
ncbi:hypothetical protein Ga0074812_15721 [Parafrankia irregularis]|uniref:Peptidase family M41 n=1 Tax=Parafrankia irregularis TaxID=795642 RepID=A0A0S4QZR7_9ACTN|nr:MULTISPECIES: hypothetical protein [Parafrankia]MBE3206818.1 hypothetical protein [Parafrankia sp. CH37]CUU61131.1 hypothetical protein Ga0074812_15721 [Parafrankia irregularis]